jgi:hypothetical protein
MGEHAAAAALMREALAGRRVLSDVHPYTRDAIAAMDRIEKNKLVKETAAATVADEEEEEGREEEEEEETMYQRLAKRHRRA